MYELGLKPSSLSITLIRDLFVDSLALSHLHARACNCLKARSHIAIKSYRGKPPPKEHLQETRFGVLHHIVSPRSSHYIIHVLVKLCIQQA